MGEFDEETRKVLVTTTLIVVLFTTIVLGGGTMPLMKYLESKASGRNRRRRKKDITLSKTSEFGSAIDSEHLSELKDGKSHVTKLTDKWSRDIQSSPLVSDLSDID